MMSVASKTKTKMYTTVALGLLVALSALPTWANTSPGITPTVQTSVVSTQTSNQDLSVLRTKLKERFSWVAQEVRSLVDWTTTPVESFHGSAPRTIDVNQGISLKPANVGQDFFVDSQNDPYDSYINRLAAYGVLSPSQKFYPQNYFRVDDFVGVVKKISAKQQISLPADFLSLTTDDGIMTKWVLQQIMLSLGKDDIQMDGNPYDKLIRSEWAYYLVRMFDLPVLEVVGHASSVSTTLPNYFSDTLGHRFAPAINTLASLDILNTQTKMFYPDNYLRHYDFVMIFVNSLLSFKAQSLTNVSTSSFADVDATASYLSQLTYASDRWLIDYIVTSKRGQLYFDPNAFMTKHEVYQILSKTLNIQFSYNVEQADTEKMTRAEMAQIIVESFWFEPKISEPESDVQAWSENDVTLLNKLKVLLSMI